MLGRLFLAFVFLFGGLGQFIAGGRGCQSEGVIVTESEAFGPFDTEPTIEFRSHSTSVVTAETGRIWVLWTNPDVEADEGIRVVFQYTSVPGQADGVVMMDQVMQVPEDDGGIVFFDPPPGGAWFAGATVEVALSRGDTQFASVTFPIATGSSQQ